MGVGKKNFGGGGMLQIITAIKSFNEPVHLFILTTKLSEYTLLTGILIHKIPCYVLQIKFICLITMSM